jgi:hypothetical protein
MGLSHFTGGIQLQVGAEWVGGVDGYLGWDSAVPLVALHVVLTEKWW